MSDAIHTETGQYVEIRRLDHDECINCEFSFAQVGYTGICRILSTKDGHNKVVYRGHICEFYRRQEEE